jgi:hypothetical protein
MFRYLKIGALAACCAGLSGCAGSIVGDAIAGPEKLAQADDSYCRSIGLQFGTPDYANCREAATQRRDNHHARGAAMVSQGLAIAATPPPQTSCTSVRNGNVVQTNCN